MQIHRLCRFLKDRGMVATEDNKSQPRYQDVADVLIDEISVGEFPVGSMLPTELELCERFGVSRYTVREALRRLEEMGLVARRQGSGTVVQATSAGAGFVQTVHSLSQLLQYPPETRLFVEERKLLKTDRGNARLLQSPIGQKWFRLSGVRRVHASGQPICWSDIYLAPEYKGVADFLDMRAGPVYSTVEREYKVQIDHVGIEMFASTVPDELAPALEVESGTSVMTIIRRYTSRENRTFEISVSIHPEGRFTYNFELKREWRFPTS
jgi:GntR family transcriptional regulator